MKAAENFVEETSKPEENFDESLFVEFMKKVPIWDFYCIQNKCISPCQKKKRERKYQSIILT